jgi:hypothetical protein
MTAEVKVVEHVDDIVQTVLVSPAQVVQDSNFNQRLVMEAALIPINNKQ